VIRLLADENVNAAIVRALRSPLVPQALVTVQELDRRGHSDDELRRFAAEQGENPKVEKG
jgi:hypothetical protein